MKRILFVDDEPNVLQGLQRMLRPLRQEWAMSFAPGGPEALALLENETFDVVVSDMRMPHMDGAQLLMEVLNRSPRTARIILTGQSDRQMTLRAIKVAHQQLSKPCDPETLKVTVQRVCALRALLHDEKLIALASSQVALPTLPALYMRVLVELEKPDPSLERLAEVIAQDMGMTAKILQVVNSSFFGLGHRVTNPSQAIRLLGLETVQSVILTISLLSQFEMASLQPWAIEDLWQWSQRVAELAGLIARCQQAPRLVVEQASLAGLLHVAGILVLAKQSPPRYIKLLDQARNQGRSLADIEREILGTSHAEIGAYLLGLWALPDPVVEAVAWYSNPQACPATGLTPLVLLHTAAALLGEVAGRAPFPTHVLDQAYLEKLGLQAEVATWRQLLAKGPAGERPC